MPSVAQTSIFTRMLGDVAGVRDGAQSCRTNDREGTSLT